jgi:hypothetical protein
VVAPQVYLDAQGQIFKAEINGIDGRVTDVARTATWMFNPHFGSVSATTVSRPRPTSQGRRSTDACAGLSGLQLFVTARSERRVPCARG